MREDCLSCNIAISVLKIGVIVVKIHLHIGTHKTGTTSIQKFLDHNRSKLLDLGYLYPLSGRPDALSVAQHKLPWGFMGAKRLKKAAGKQEGLRQEWNKLHKEIAREKKQNVIISAEDFSNLKAKRIRAVKKRLSRYDTKVVVYLRKQDDFFLSSYSQVLKGSAFYKSIEEYIKQGWHRGNYYDFLEVWSKAFGKENIVVKVYEQLQMKQGLMPSFLEAIGLGADVNELEQLDEVANVRPNEKTLKLLRRLNWLVRKKSFTTSIVM